MQLIVLVPLGAYVAYVLVALLLLLVGCAVGAGRMAWERFRPRLSDELRAWIESGLARAQARLSRLFQPVDATPDDK
ncbi:MAG: hypothetical protein KBC32_08750 [Candidatus Didemnitutus sp.]|nr:hypothetical protein [Candidatus Didemnitutus sp.]